MWKGKGKLNMEVILAQTFTPKNEVRPNSNESMQGHIPLDSDSGPSNQLTQQDGTDLPAQGSETNNSVSDESIAKRDKKIQWSRYSNGKASFEVSTKGTELGKRFSAFWARMLDSFLLDKISLKPNIKGNLNL